MIETYNSAGYRDIVDDFVVSPLSPQHARFSPPALPPSYPFISSYPPPPLYGSYVPHSPALPKFPPPQFEIPEINLCTSSEPFDYGSQFVLPPISTNTFLTPSVIPPRHRGMMDPHMVAPSGSTPDSSTNTSPSRESGEEYSSDDSVPLAQLAMKRSAPDDTVDRVGLSQPKKPKTPKKRKKKDPNEPQKPVSGYALFFRDTQAAIKGQNPSASFGEVSKIVASMWDNLDDEHKSVYKKKTEMAKKEYLKQLAAYRASLVLKGGESPEAQDKSPPQQQSYQRVAPRHPPNMPSVPILPPVSSPCSPQSPPGGYMDGYQQQQVGASPPGMLNMSPPSDYHMNQQVMGATMNSDPVYGGSMSPSMCIRNGCPNLAIVNPGWDSEYCSNECVVNHCRDVFTAWVASRQMSPSYASVK